MHSVTTMRSEDRHPPRHAAALERCARGGWIVPALLMFAGAALAQPRLLVVLSPAPTAIFSTASD